MANNPTEATETFDPKQSGLYGVQLSESARQHISAELAKSEDMKGFRLFLQTSGCSGFMYQTELKDEAPENDEIFQFDELEVYVPRKDLPVLNGTVIDFIQVGLNSMFQFRNPNVTGECGCGESFSVTEDDE